MSFSIQTNVNAMNGQENLRVNQEFQSRTINRLTSGYRLNSAADDAAGLSVANKYRNDVMSLQQGVRNANDGISALQVVDGGLNNISKILDRMTTLATQAATDTFTGDRAILQDEYNTLIGEINRQASNVGLSGIDGTVGARYNKNISVFIGGGQGLQANSQIGVDLSGGSSTVDAASLGLAATSISDGTLASGLAGNSVNLKTAGPFLNSAGATQVLTFQTANSTITATVAGSASGLSGNEVVTQLNSQLTSQGITASINDTTGALEFSSNRAYTVSTGSASAGTAFATAASTGRNDSLYRHDGTATYAAPAASEALTFTVGSNTVSVTIAAGETKAAALVKLNTALNSNGVYAVQNSAGTGIEFQSAGTFSVTTADTVADGVFNGAYSTAVTAPVGASSPTSNALAAITKITEAVASLSTVQGKVGTGLNKLQYAIQLAQSQISNFSAAESRIRDADVAAEAANLTKAQVLQQASMAAMAQANSAPQAVLALLRG